MRSPALPLQISGLFRRFLRLLSLRQPDRRGLLAGVDEASHLGSSCSESQLRRIAMYCLSRRSAFRLALLAAAFPLVMSIPSLAAESPLAIKGYDPVAYFTDGKPTRGLPEFEFQWDGHRYHFASAEHRDLFKADPERYAPQFGNYCA